MSATQTSKESGALIQAKECADDMGINLAAYIEKCFHTSAEELADWQRLKIATDLHLFRKCKAFFDETQHYHPCQDCKSLVRCREQVCGEFSYGICNRCLEGEPY
jgi:hypothetical protein